MMMMMMTYGNNICFLKNCNCSKGEKLNVAVDDGFLNNATPTSTFVRRRDSCG
jgi:hypothetical protein